MLDEFFNVHMNHPNLAITSVNEIQMLFGNVDKLINFFVGRRREIRVFLAREKSADMERNIFGNIRKPRRLRVHIFGRIVHCWHD